MLYASVKLEAYAVVFCVEFRLEEAFCTSADPSRCVRSHEDIQDEYVNQNLLPCFDLYNLYKKLEVWIHRKTAPEAVELCMNLA